METKSIMTFIAILLPVLVWLLLMGLVLFNRKPDWRIVVCLSSLTVVTSLLLLMASEKIKFVRYGEAMVEINEKADEVRKLTEQNKQMARLTAKAIITAQNGAILGAGYNENALFTTLQELLSTAGATTNEVNQILGRTNSVHP